MTLPAQARPRLLLIDNDPASQRELRWALGDDFELAHAADGLAGLRRAQAQRPDLILLEVALPGANGHTVARLLRQDLGTCEIPVIFLSAMDQPGDRLTGFELGAVDYVGKPFHAAEVRARVQVHLRRSAAAPLPPSAHVDMMPALRTCSAAAVQAAMHYIERHLAEVPPVSEIARQVGTSEQRLLALFREHQGLTVSGYVAESRVRTGCRLLSQTQMSVQEVAFEVGFRSPGNFITAFKERLGLTPKAWRQAAIKEVNKSVIKAREAPTEVAPL